MSSQGKIVAIIGSGIIGKSYAQMYAVNGYTVHLFDTIVDQVNKCIAHIRHDVSLAEGVKSEEVLKRVLPFTDVSQAIKGAIIIQECTPERFEIKQEVYKGIDPHMIEGQILSSSTSTMLPSKLSENLKHRNRFVVSHPVNPINVVPIVEVIPAPWTDKDVVETMKTVLTQCGKEPIVLTKEIPGFIVNRLQYATLNECYSLIQHGILSVADVDKVMSDGLGLRWAFLGPLQVAYLNANSWEDYCDKYRSTIKAVSDTFDPPQLYEGPTAQTISKQLQTLIPSDRMPEARDKLATQMKELLKLKRNQ